MQWVGCGWGLRCRELEDFELCGSGHCVLTKEEDLPGVWPEVAMSQTCQPRSPVGTMSACIVLVVIFVVCNEDPLPLEAEPMVAASVTSTVSLPMSSQLDCDACPLSFCHLSGPWQTYECLTHALGKAPSRLLLVSRLAEGPTYLVPPTPQVT